ncbi:GroES-like protein [Venturia nashicola]|uniref:GroES-like protein n=1 Tax=Venturia nashicola TaxID=86259 RepID=A0A4Z1PQ15_9PEZI|nr:GroES-like protein [Venturia nashicola]
MLVVEEERGGSDEHRVQMPSSAADTGFFQDASNLRLRHDGNIHNNISHHLNFISHLQTAIKELTPDKLGCTHILDTSPSIPVLAACLEALRNNGTLLQVGVKPVGGRLELDLLEHMVHGRRLVGVIEGDRDPAEALPELVKWCKNGTLPVGKMLKEYPVKDFEQARSDMEKVFLSRFRKRPGVRARNAFTSVQGLGDAMASAPRSRSDIEPMLKEIVPRRPHDIRVHQNTKIYGSMERTPTTGNVMIIICSYCEQQANPSISVNFFVGETEAHPKTAIKTIAKVHFGFSTHT